MNDAEAGASLGDRFWASAIVALSDSHRPVAVVPRCGVRRPKAVIRPNASTFDADGHRLAAKRAVAHQPDDGAPRRHAHSKQFASTADEHECNAKDHGPRGAVLPTAAAQGTNINSLP